MDDLKTLHAELATVRAEQSKASAQLGDIAAEEFDLKSNPGTKAAKIAAAEENLIDQLHRLDIGETHDVPAAEKALAEAKALPDDGFAAAARLRTLATFRQRAETEHQACHERGLVIMAAIKQAEVEALRIQANEVRNDAEVAMETVARSEFLLNAIRAELNERGASYDLPALNEQAVAYRARLNPNQARSEVVAALAA